MSTPSAHVQPVQSPQYQGFSGKGQQIPTSQPQPAWAQHEANYTNPYHPQPVAQQYVPTTPAPYAAPGAVPAPAQQQAVGANQYNNQRPTWSACGSFSYGCAMAFLFSFFTGLLLGWCAFFLLLSNSTRLKLHTGAFAGGVSLVSAIGNVLLIVFLVNRGVFS